MNIDVLNYADDEVIAAIKSRPQNKVIPWADFLKALSNAKKHRLLSMDIGTPKKEVKNTNPLVSFFSTIKTLIVTMSKSIDRGFNQALLENNMPLMSREVESISVCLPDSNESVTFKIGNIIISYHRGKLENNTVWFYPKLDGANTSKELEQVILAALNLFSIRARLPEPIVQLPIAPWDGIQGDLSYPLELPTLLSKPMFATRAGKMWKEFVTRKSDFSKILPLPPWHVFGTGDSGVDNECWQMGAQRSPKSYGPEKARQVWEKFVSQIPITCYLDSVEQILAALPFQVSDKCKKAFEEIWKEYDQWSWEVGCAGPGPLPLAMHITELNLNEKWGILFRNGSNVVTGTLKISTQEVSEIKENEPVGI